MFYFLSDAIMGLVKLVIFALLPYFLLHAAFTKIMGGKIDFARYGKVVVALVRHILFLVGKISSAAANQAADSKLGRRCLKLIIGSTIVVLLLTCLARLAHTDHQRCQLRSFDGQYLD